MNPIIPGQSPLPGYYPPSWTTSQNATFNGIPWYHHYYLNPPLIHPGYYNLPQNQTPANVPVSKSLEPKRGIPKPKRRPVPRTPSSPSPQIERATPTSLTKLHGLTLATPSPPTVFRKKLFSYHRRNGFRKLRSPSQTATSSSTEENGRPLALRRSSRVIARPRKYQE